MEDEMKKENLNEWGLQNFRKSSNEILLFALNFQIFVTI